MPHLAINKNPKCLSIYRSRVACNGLGRFHCTVQYIAGRLGDIQMRQRDMATVRSLLFQEFSGQPESELKFQKFNIQMSPGLNIIDCHLG